MKFSVNTERNGKDIYDLRLSGLYCCVDHGKPVWNKTPQLLAVLIHIILGHGAYKGREISLFTI